MRVPLIGQELQNPGTVTTLRQLETSALPLIVEVLSCNTKVNFQRYPVHEVSFTENPLRYIFTRECHITAQLGQVLKATVVNPANKIEMRDYKHIYTYLVCVFVKRLAFL